MFYPNYILLLALLAPRNMHRPCSLDLGLILVLRENAFSKLVCYKGQDCATEIVDMAGQVGFAYRLWDVSISYSFQDDYTIIDTKHIIGIPGFMVI